MITTTRVVLSRRDNCVPVQLGELRNGGRGRAEAARGNELGAAICRSCGLVSQLASELPVENRLTRRAELAFGLPLLRADSLSRSLSQDAAEKHCNDDTEGLEYPPGDHARADDSQEPSGQGKREQLPPHGSRGNRRRVVIDHANALVKPVQPIPQPHQSILAEDPRVTRANRCRSPNGSSGLRGRGLGTISGMRARPAVGLLVSTSAALGIGRLGFGSWTAAVVLLVLVAVVVLPFSLARDRRAKQAHGLPSDTPTEATREVRMSLAPEAALEQAALAFSSVEFVKSASVRVDRQRGLVRARTRMTGGSWGERLTATVSPIDDGARVVIESRGVVPQLIDYGKNARNVAAICQQLWTTNTSG